MKISGILLLLVLFLLFFGVFPLIIMSWFLYRALLVRFRPDMWGRSCSMPEDPVQQEMFQRGNAWSEAHSASFSEVSIENEGLHLFGRFYDFGQNKAVVILPGRMESCLYSLFFAEPYEKAGWDVLVIDQRAHGLSDGKYNTLGKGESRDVIAWIRFLREKYGIRKVVLHGCCIGASCAMYTATSPECPEEVKGIVTEGMYGTFGESFREHLIQKRKPQFFTVPFALQVKLHTGTDILRDGPFYRIPELRKPILMLHSREDIFSLPARARMLYDRCGSKTEKELVWFEHGEHSRIRYRDPEGYDRAIGAFLRKL